MAIAAKQSLHSDAQTLKFEDDKKKWREILKTIVDTPFHAEDDAEGAAADVRAPVKWKRLSTESLQKWSADELKRLIDEKKTNHDQLWKHTLKRMDETCKDWQDRIPHVRVKGENVPDFGRLPDARAQRLVGTPNRGRESYSVVIDGKETHFSKPRFPYGHFFKYKQRARLPKQKDPKEPEDELTQEEYMTEVEKKFQKNLGKDGEVFYEMLGECYVHGMMDGEAMAHQNNEGIPTTVFEIR